ASIAGRLPQAEAFFRHAIAIKPKLVPAWQGLGVVLSANSKFDEALDTLKRVIELSPKSGMAYFQLGQLQDRISDWNGAQVTYQMALDFEPKNRGAKNNLAGNYAKQGGNIDVALRLAQEANQAQPNNQKICDPRGWF